MKGWGGNKSDEERGSVAEARASARGSQKRQSVRTEPLPTHTKDGASSGGAASTSGGMFADADALKGAAHKDLDKREFDIMDYYHTRGVMQCIGRHSLFGNATLVVIMLNSLWIGLEMDLNDAENLNDADWPFQFGEYFFFVYFSFEWIVRYGSLRRKRDGLLDKWFIFDSALVGLMWFETAFMPALLGIITAAQGGPKDEEGGGSSDSGMGDLSMLRMFRLLRLTRMVRFMRAVPELVTLLKSMTIALRSVISTLTLLVLFMYIFAIVFKSQMSPKVLENEFLEDKFGRIPSAMWTLLMSGAFMDNVTVCANTLLDNSPLLTVVFISFIFLASFTVLNMLIGMLCEVVTAVAAAEKEKAIVVFVKSRLFDALESLDKDHSGTISKDEFEKLLEIPAAVQALDELGVDVPNLVSMKNHLFEAEEMERMGVEVVDKNESGKDNEQPGLKSKGVAGADDDSDFEFMEENSVEGEEKTAALAFADFLEMVIRLRADNRPSVLDIVDLRKLVLKNNRSVLTSVDGLEKMNGRLTKKMQDVTSTLDRFCTSHRQMLLGLPLEAPQGPPFSASRSMPEAKPPQNSLKLAGKANDVLVLDEPPRPVLESLDFFDRPESFDEAPFSNVLCESDPTGRPIAASGPKAAAAEAPGRPPEDPQLNDIFLAGDDNAPIQPSSSWMDPQERRWFNDAASSSHVSSISGDGDSITDTLDIECAGDTHSPGTFTL